MNRANFLKLIVLGFILSVTAVGCKKTPTNPTPIPNLTRTGPGSAPIIGPTGGDQSVRIPQPADVNPSTLKTDPSGTELGPRIDKGDYWGDHEIFKDQTVYFDFDSSNVRPGDKSKIDAVAQHLKSQPSFKVEIEGHCDERGTEEYNRALGERRALSVREYLISVGITGERINTISYGEDKAAVLGHDEAAWAKNRRGEFLLLKPKTP